MKRTKWMILATVVLTLGALSFGLVGLWNQSSVHALSSAVPKVVTILPENADFVAFIDVRKLLYSPVYQAFENEHGEKFAAKLQEFIKMTGLDPRKDLDSVVFSAYRDENNVNLPVAIVVGAFDQDKIAALIASKTNTKAFNHKGVTLFTKPNDHAKDGDADEVAGFLGDKYLLFGKMPAVSAVIDAQKNNRPGILSNQAFIELFNQTPPDATFWVVSTNLNLFQRFQPRQDDAKPKLLPNLPPIDNFMMYGDLGNMISITLKTKCSDEKASQNVSDFVRGMIALGKMTLQQKPEMSGMLEDIQVHMEKTTVSMDIKMPFEDLKKLQDWNKSEKQLKQPKEKVSKTGV